MPSSLRRVSLATALLATLAIAACSSGSSPSPSATTPAASAPAASAPAGSAGAGTNVDVEIRDSILPEVTAKVGDNIVWTNEDAIPHSVVLDDNSVTSEIFNQGETYEHAFDAAGTFPYHCSVHPAMKATITISG